MSEHQPSSGDFNREAIVPRDPLVVLATEYGDWGNRCMTAYGTYLWPLHIENCEQCRAVQAAWDAQEKRGAA